MGLDSSQELKKEYLVPKKNLLNYSKCMTFNM